MLFELGLEFRLQPLAVPAEHQQDCSVQRASSQLVVCHEGGYHSAASKLAPIHDTLRRHGTRDIPKVEDDFADT